MNNYTLNRDMFNALAGELVRINAHSYDDTEMQQYAYAFITFQMAADMTRKAIANGEIRNDQQLEAFLGGAGNGAMLVDRGVSYIMTQWDPELRDASSTEIGTATYNYFNQRNVVMPQEVIDGLPSDRLPVDFRLNYTQSDGTQVNAPKILIPMTADTNQTLLLNPASVTQLDANEIVALSTEPRMRAAVKQIVAQAPYQFTDRSAAPQTEEPEAVREQEPAQAPTVAEKMQQQVAELQAQLNEMRTIIEGQKTQISGYREEIREQNREIEAKDDRIARLEEQLADRDATIATLRDTRQAELNEKLQPTREMIHGSGGREKAGDGSGLGGVTVPMDEAREHLRNATIHRSTPAATSVQQPAEVSATRPAYLDRIEEAAVGFARDGMDGDNTNDREALQTILNALNIQSPIGFTNQGARHTPNDFLLKSEYDRGLLAIHAAMQDGQIDVDEVQSLQRSFQDVKLTIDTEGKDDVLTGSELSNQSRTRMRQQVMGQ